MDLSTKNQEIQEVSSVDEIINNFDEFVKTNNINLPKEKIFDFIARISYFYNNSDKSVLTPYFNKSIGHEQYGDETTSFRNLLTVPKTVNNYYEYGKGNLIPFCKFSNIDNVHSSRNDYTIYVDIENDIVYANVSVTRLIRGKSGNVIDEADFCVSNYCIPNVTTLVRGRAKDIMQQKQKVLTFKEQYSDFSAYEETLKKAVIIINRVDTDTKHPNRFEDIPNANKDKLRLAREIFKEKAESPHFHFCCKDFILIHRETDSSSMAISVNQLPDYLVKLISADKNDEIVREDFGMPFVDIKKRNTYYNHETIKTLMEGIRDSYKKFTKQDKEDFKYLYNFEINELSKIMSRKKKDNDVNEFKRQSDFLYSVITDTSDELKSKDYENIDALTVLNAETIFLKLLSKFKTTNRKLRTKFNSSYNDFFTTVNYSLGKKKIFTKNKNNNYNYSNGNFNENEIEEGFIK